MGEHGGMMVSEALESSVEIIGHDVDSVQQPNDSQQSGPTLSDKRSLQWKQS